MLNLVAGFIEATTFSLQGEGKVYVYFKNYARVFND